MKKTRISLVASQLPCCQVDRGNIVFLNEFSKDYELYKNYNPKKIQTIRHPWVNENRKRKDEKYAKLLAEKLANEIGLKLNNIHKINKSKKYWDFLLLLWTYNYVSLYLEKWRCTEEFLKRYRYKNFYTTGIKTSNKYEIASSDDFYKLSQQDFYNQIIIQNILKFKKIKKIFYKNFTIKNLFYKNFTINNLKKKNKKSKILRLFRNFFFNIVLKNNQYYFDRVLPMITYFKFCILLRIIPFFLKNDDLYEYRSKKFDKNLRKKININLKEKDEFETFLTANIKYEIPKIFIESYNDLIICLKKINCKKIKYLSGYDFWREDIIKVWIAENRSKNFKLITMDHGGLFPLKNSFNYDYPSIISDYYLSINKRNNIGLNKTSIQTPRVSKKKKYLPSLKKKNKILFVLNQFYRFNVGVGGFIGEQNLHIVNSMNKIFENLPSNIVKNIRVREKHDNKWKFFERLKDIAGINLEEYQYWNCKPLRKLLSETQIFISTYPDTVFLDGLDNNIPSLLFINKFWPLKNEYYKSYHILKKAKILFDDEKRLVIHLKKIYNNPNDWWLSNQTKAAIKIINNQHFIGNIQDKSKEFLKLIKKL